jgi:cellulose synthase/poly-beta-1,6-N-acetylglucosamine synthase-like glycosyltransferase
MGKCWALHQGAQIATGAWLLFVDADTRLRPGAVAGAIAAATDRNVAMFSVLTAQEVPTWWERIVQPAVFAALAEALPAGLVNNPRLPHYALANGQFLMVRRAAYDAIGGHAAIRGEIADDAQLARRAKRLGLPFWLGDGRRLATTRMYASPRALWEGWTKNLHAGMQLLPWLVPPGTAYMALALAGPYVSLYAAARRRSAALALAGGAQLLAALARRRSVNTIFGIPVRYTLAQPLGDLAFLSLLLASFYKVLSGQGVTWKGRRYYAAGPESQALAR